MSHVEEALKRARESAGTAPPSGEPPASTGDPQADAFVAPWTFENGAAARERASGAATREEPLRPEPASGPAATSPLAVFSGFDPTVIEKLVAAAHLDPAPLEQYRKLAASLHHAQVDRGLKIVMVASAVAGEGKTLTSTNLALTFSESYRRQVLLIDADLRRPTLHELFQVPNMFGLTDGLQADKESPLSVIEISPRLSLLPAGRPALDPLSLLTSNRMRRVIDEARQHFDWVIVDTPPVVLLPDANLLAAMVDTALLVVEAARTPYRAVQRAVQAIGRDRIAGIVLNRGNHTQHAYEYKYDHYYNPRHPKPRMPRLGAERRDPARQVTAAPSPSSDAPQGR